MQMALYNHSSLSLRSIEAFVAIAEEQSVSKAAKRLGASVSSVSMQLSNLEKVLDARLVERSAQRFALTEAGLAFRQRALRILDELDGARGDFTNRKGSPHFILRMAVVEDFDTHILPQWLEALSGAFPNARFAVKSGPSHENFSILGSRATDLIVAVDAMDPVDWIEEHPLMRDPYLLVMSKRLSGKPDERLLSRHPFIRYAREQHMGRQIEAQLRRIKFVPPHLHEFSSNQALFSMVAQTGGWCISTAAAIHGTLSQENGLLHKLRFHKLPFPAFSRNVSLYARKDILSEMPETAAQNLRTVLASVFDPQSNSINLPLLPEVHRPGEPLLD